MAIDYFAKENGLTTLPNSAFNQNQPCPACGRPNINFGFDKDTNICPHCKKLIRGLISDISRSKARRLLTKAKKKGASKTVVGLLSRIYQIKTEENRRKREGN